MRLRAALIALIGVAALVAAVTVGFVWGRADHGGPSAVDIGFARDMSTHHDQAVRMSSYALAGSTTPLVRSVANDIHYTQLSQLGIMTGWLEQWNVSAVSETPMSWMGMAHDHVDADGLMPGMATAAELTELQAAHGHKLDMLFLQLMIRHHQGALDMAQYAAENASTSYVRVLARKMYDNQTGEIVQMEQLLRQLGGVPLSPPD